MKLARPRSRTDRALLVAAALAALLVASSPGTPARAQLAPLAYDRGATGLALALRRLPVAASVLCVTAHPDDEDNGVLVLLSRVRGLRTGLLTLTRGQGGQNEVGPELFDALAVLRTEELAAVHRYDGVEQIFGRAVDFGYSFSIEETFERWGHEETLGDVVRGVRAFRPDVMLTLPLESEGGGQHHQAAARLAREAFRAAADPGRFPEQVAAGLPPWQPRKLYQGGVGGGRLEIAGARPVVLRTGLHDPVIGLSPHELGTIARARHRSQAQGRLKADPLEGRASYFLVDSEPPVSAPEGDILEGIDVALAALARFAAGGATVPSFRDDLATLQRKVEAAQAAFDPSRPSLTLPSLGEALGRVRGIRERIRIGGLGPGPRHELAHRLEAKEREILDAIALAEGVGFEVLARDDEVVPGQSLEVTARIWNRADRPLSVHGVSLSVPEGWTVEPGRTGSQVLEPWTDATLEFVVGVSPTARYSQPYWSIPRGAGRARLEVPEHEGRPWSPPDVRAALAYASHGGAAGHVEAPAMWRYLDRESGREKQKVVQVVPPISVRVSPPIAVVPAAGPPVPREFRVAASAGGSEAGAATIALEVPPRWRVEPPEERVSFAGEDDEVTVRFIVTPPERRKPGDAEVRAVVREGGREFRTGVQEVDYPHVQERHLLQPASARLKVLDVRTAAGVFIGYVAGTGDDVAGAIAQLGLRVTPLEAEDLAFGDLSRYTTIVTGVRAYEARPDLRSHHRRVMEYVENGGNLVVQYNRIHFNYASDAARAARPRTTPPREPDSPFAPYPAAVTTKRITDETAPVEVLVPGHRLLSDPNRIGPADWEGWVQERGLQFLEARDPRYVDLLSMSDPFPKNPGTKTGVLVVARVGKGTWTYVGLGLFRQVPAATSGAYRLLANLVSRPRGR